MNDLRILADDLTGALDSAAAFGGVVPVHLGRPPAFGHDNEGVSVVATATRDIPLEALPAHLDASLRWLSGAALAFKKVDSLLRGNTFAEVAYAVRAGGFRGAVFAPAFPAVGRVTIAGRQCTLAPGAPIDAREPVGAGAPTDAFAVLGLATVGGNDLPPVPATPAVWLPQVQDDADLARIAAASQRPEARQWLWCGSGGLAHAFAAVHRLTPPPGDFFVPAMRTGPVLVISASHHPVVRRQWDIVRSAERGAVMVTHGQQATLRSAIRAVGHGLDFALFDLAPARLLARDEAARRLTRQLDAIVRGSPRPAALLVVGGDTLLGLCQAAAVQALHASASRRAGWGFARLIGGPWHDVPCFSRSGAFGGADDLASMVRVLAHSNETIEV